MMNSQSQVLELLHSGRGKFIMGQALSTAIEAMRKKPGREQEKSNLSDMELLQELFPFYTGGR